MIIRWTKHTPFPSSSLGIQEVLSSHSDSNGGKAKLYRIYKSKYFTSIGLVLSDLIVLACFKNTPFPSTNIAIQLPLAWIFLRRPHKNEYQLGAWASSAANVLCSNFFFICPFIRLSHVLCVWHFGTKFETTTFRRNFYFLSIE